MQGRQQEQSNEHQQVGAARQSNEHQQVGAARLSLHRDAPSPKLLEEQLNRARLAVGRARGLGKNEVLAGLPQAQVPPQPLLPQHRHAIPVQTAAPPVVADEPSRVGEDGGVTI